MRTGNVLSYKVSRYLEMNSIDLDFPSLGAPYIIPPGCLTSIHPKIVFSILYVELVQIAYSSESTGWSLRSIFGLTKVGFSTVFIFYVLSFFSRSMLLHLKFLVLFFQSLLVPAVL